MIAFHANDYNATCKKKNKWKERPALALVSKEFQWEEEEEELAVVRCKCVIVTHANDLRAEKWYGQTSGVWAKQVFGISKRGSVSGNWVLSQ